MKPGDRVAEEQARAFLAALGATREALRAQMLVGPDAAGWLLRPPEARLERPDRVEWVASRRYRESRGEFRFMPPELVGSEPPPLHAFMAVPGAGDVVYLGTPHLAAYGYSGFPSRGEMSLHLRPRLSVDTWLLLGGKAGFSVTGAGDGLSAGEAEAAVAVALAAGGGTLCVAGFDEPSLTILVNRDRAFVMLLRDDDDAGVTAADPAAAADESPERFTLDNGQVDEFARAETVDHEQALACVRAFLRDRTLGSGVLLREG